MEAYPGYQGDNIRPSTPWSRAAGGYSSHLLRLLGFLQPKVECQTVLAYADDFCDIVNLRTKFQLIHGGLVMFYSITTSEMVTQLTIHEDLSWINTLHESISSHLNFAATASIDE